MLEVCWTGAAEQSNNCRTQSPTATLAIIFYIELAVQTMMFPLYKSNFMPFTKLFGKKAMK